MSLLCYFESHSCYYDVPIRSDAIIPYQQNLMSEQSQHAESCTKQCHPVFGQYSQKNTSQHCGPVKCVPLTWMYA